MTEITIKTDNKETIHSACLELIKMLNMTTRELSEKLNIKYNTAFKKRTKTQDLSLNKNDLIILMNFYDEVEKENIMKRREIIDFMHSLKIK